MSKKQKQLFECETPCGNCPYKKDSALAFWSIEEFEKVLKAETEVIAPIFLCHKNNGSICVGYLMNQEKRGFPSNGLRLQLIKHEIDSSFFDKLHSSSELFETVEEMCFASFEELKIYAEKLKRENLWNEK